MRADVEEKSRIAGEQADAINSKLDAILAVLARHKAPGAPDRDAFSSAVEEKAVKDIVGATDHAAEEAGKLLQSGQIDAALVLLRSDAIAAGKAAAMRWRRLGNLAFSVNVAEARHAYIQAIALDPTHIDTFVLLIRLDIAAGDLPAAEKYSLHAMAACKSPCERFSVLIKLGDIRVRQRRNADARKHFEEAYILSCGEVSRAPEDSEILHDHQLILERMYESCMESGDVLAARFFIEECHRLAVRCFVENAQSTKTTSGLASSHNFFGDLEMKAGNLQRASEHYARSLELRSLLASLPNASIKWVRDVGISLNKMGDVSKAMGDRGTAERYFSESISWREKRMRGDPSNIELKRDGYVAYLKFAKLLLSDLSRQDVDKAVGDAIEIAEELVNLDPSNLFWQQDLIGAYCLACRRSSERGDEASLIGFMERASYRLKRIDLSNDTSATVSKAWATLYTHAAGAGQYQAARQICAIGRMLVETNRTCPQVTGDTLTAEMFWNEMSADVERDHGQPRDALPHLRAAWIAGKKRHRLVFGAEDCLTDAIKLVSCL